MVLPEFARRRFQLEGDNDDAATLILKGIRNRIQLCLNLVDLIVKFPAAIARALLSLFGCGIKLLIFRRFLYFGLRLAGLIAYALEVSRIAFDEFALHASPRTLAEPLVIESPTRAEHQ